MMNTMLWLDSVKMSTELEKKGLAVLKEFDNQHQVVTMSLRKNAYDTKYMEDTIRLASISELYNEELSMDAEEIELIQKKAPTADRVLIVDLWCKPVTGLQTQEVAVIKTVVQEYVKEHPLTLLGLMYGSDDGGIVAFFQGKFLYSTWNSFDGIEINTRYKRTEESVWKDWEKQWKGWSTTSQTPNSVINKELPSTEHLE